MSGPLFYKNLARAYYGEMTDDGLVNHSYGGEQFPLTIGGLPVYFAIKSVLKNIPTDAVIANVMYEQVGKPLPVAVTALLGMASLHINTRAGTLFNTLLEQLIADTATCRLTAEQLANLSRGLGKVPKALVKLFSNIVSCGIEKTPKSFMFEIVPTNTAVKEGTAVPFGYVIRFPLLENLLSGKSVYDTEVSESQKKVLIALHDNLFPGSVAAARAGLNGAQEALFFVASSGSAKGILGGAKAVDYVMALLQNVALTYPSVFSEEDYSTADLAPVFQDAPRIVAESRLVGCMDVPEEQAPPAPKRTIPALDTPVSRSRAEPEPRYRQVERTVPEPRGRDTGRGSSQSALSRALAYTLPNDTGERTRTERSPSRVSPARRHPW